MRKIILITISILLFLAGCNKHDIAIFEKVEAYANINRDSLTHYLKQIEYPEKLPPLQRAKLGLIKTTKSPFDKKNELALDFSLDYYIKAKDTTMMIESYVAKSYYYQNSLPEKIHYLELAKCLSLEINNEIRTAYLCLNIGNCYERQGASDTAFNYLLEGLEYAPTTDYSYGLIHWSLSRLYNKKGLKKEAIESLLDVIENARVHFPKDLSPAYKQLSDIYLDLNDIEKALEYINLSIQHRTNVKEVPSYNLAKAIIFINTQELDSAYIYLNYAIESPNPYISNRGLGYLYELNNKMNQYDKAYYTIMNEDNNFRSLQSTEEAYTLQQKYMEEKLKNENNQLKLDQQQQRNYSLVITIVLLLVFVFAYIIYSYKQRQQALTKHQHEEQLLKEKALLHESQNLLLKRDNELALLHQKSATLRASLFKKMSLSLKLPSLDRENIQRSNKEKITLSEQDLSELKRTVDTAYNDFSKRLINSYPSLSEEDLVFCCLVKIQVDMQDLSDIFCISKAGITKRKMRIKKNKLQIEEQISLDEFIQSF